MQTSLPAMLTRTDRQRRVAWLLLPLLAGLLWLPEIKALWGSWRGDPSLSHGPLVPLIVVGLLWMKRERLRDWNAADWRGLLGVVFTTFIYLVAVFADVDFLKPLSLIGLALSGIWFLGGAEKFKI